MHLALAQVLKTQDHCVNLILTNNQTITRQIIDIINFDSHHPTRHKFVSLDLPPFNEINDLLELESQVSILPNEISLEVKNQVIPHLSSIMLEIKFKASYKGLTRHDKNLQGPQPTFTSILKLANEKPNIYQMH